ncbi:phototropin-1B-like [Rosa rugosa]|uniref:phototropin-1B-like n=1 Tax=Rosa rugosa TaxID=74645 RepID=UPI002B405A13|nr:phototropin-1B-like [Rosa rugosa]
MYCNSCTSVRSFSVILGRNCRFLQGPETDPATVKKIREAIDNQTDVTVQLINYTKSGKKFWNVFHLQPMRDQKILDSGEQIGLKHFKPIKPLGSGDTGSVHLVQLCGTDQYYP